MIRLRARFIGSNSLGFINNQIYDIDLIDMKMSDIGNADNRMLRIETNSIKLTSACEYGTWQKLIDNWELLALKDVSQYSTEYLPNKVKEYLRERKINKVLNG